MTLAVRIEGLYEIVLNRSDLVKNSQQNTGSQPPAFNSNCYVISDERSHKGTCVYIA